MSKKPETIIEDKFCDYVLGSEHTALAIKLVLFAGRGFPDRTILGNGKCFFIEFKIPGEELHRKQIRWKKILIRLGMNYYVCHSTKKAIKIFNKEMGSS